MPIINNNDTTWRWFEEHWGQHFTWLVKMLHFSDPSKTFKCSMPEAKNFLEQIEVQAKFLTLYVSQDFLYHHHAFPLNVSQYNATNFNYPTNASSLYHWRLHAFNINTENHFHIFFAEEIDLGMFRRLLKTFRDVDIKRAMQLEKFIKEKDGIECNTDAVESARVLSARNFFSEQSKTKCERRFNVFLSKQKKTINYYDEHLTNFCHAFTMGLASILLDNYIKPWLVSSQLATSKQAEFITNVARICLEYYLYQSLFRIFISEATSLIIHIILEKFGIEHHTILQFGKAVIPVMAGMFDLEQLPMNVSTAFGTYLGASLGLKLYRLLPKLKFEDPPSANADTQIVNEDKQRNPDSLRYRGSR